MTTNSRHYPDSTAANFQLHFQLQTQTTSRDIRRAVSQRYREAVPNFILSIIYDINGQIIQSLSANHLDGYEAVENTYTFTGKPKTVKHVHTTNESKANKNTIEENYTYNYDHAERITSVNYTLGNNTITLATNTYDELGRLKSKSHHGSNANIITYDYNTRDGLRK